TICHAWIRPDGSHADDYKDCAVTKKDCTDLGKEAAEKTCSDCILKKVLGFIGDWAGADSIGGEATKTIGSIIAFAIMRWSIKTGCKGAVGGDVAKQRVGAAREDRKS